MTASPYMVELIWNTEADGSPVPEHVPESEMPRCVFGPFESEDSASRWLDDWPDDPDMHECYVRGFDAGIGVVNDPADFRFGSAAS